MARTAPTGLKDSEATPIRLDAAAPDLAMAHLDGHKIAFGELEKHEPAIGEGGYATVFRGTYRGEVVAIKQLKSGADDAIDPWSMPGGGDGQADAQRRTYEEFRHEVWIMSGLAHPNLVALRGFCTEPACIVTEFVGAGTLLEFLADRAKPLDWPLRLKIAKDVGTRTLTSISTQATHTKRLLTSTKHTIIDVHTAKGCAFLHSTSPPVMHRDLKSPNILVPSPNLHHTAAHTRCGATVNTFGSGNQLADLSPDAEVVAKVCDFGVSLSAAHHTAGRRVDCPST
jgi:serine/threonine protein kinase